MKILIYWITNPTDMVGSKAIIVASFGTTHKDTREKTIDCLEKEISEAYPDYEVRRAFTSRVVINILKKRDGLCVDYIEEAIIKLANEGFKEVIIQPTMVMNAIEYEDIVYYATKHEDLFENIYVGRSLLTSEQDYDLIVENTESIIENEIKTSIDGDTALVFMGHGSDHHSNSAYSQLFMKYQLNNHHNIYITTVEGFPNLNDVVPLLKHKPIKKIILTPLMLVAGDHAVNDMAGDEEDSLKSILEKEGYEVIPLIKGLGEYKFIRDIYISHIENTINEYAG